MRQKSSLWSRGTRQKVHPRSNSRDSSLGMGGGGRELDTHSLRLAWGTQRITAISLTPVVCQVLPVRT